MEKLEEYQDTEHYACDLGYTLFEAENIDGTFTYNYFETMNWIKTYFEDIGEVWEELQFQFGSDFLVKYNPFNNPEQFMCLIIIESASYLISRCKTINNNWNDKIVLDNNTIKNIKEELKELERSEYIYA